MEYSSIYFAVFWIFSLSFAKPIQDLPVCIVGAGPAGLAAAAQLASKNKTTVLFEKQAAVGGKCQAIYSNGTFIPLGALIYTSPTYFESIKVINISGVVPVPYTSGQQWQYNWTTGAVAQTPSTSAAFTELLAEEIATYIAWWEVNFPPYNKASGYKDGIPLNLTVTTAEWLLQNQYQALPIVFIETMVAYGYGDYREVPIIYMLQYLTPDVLSDLLKVEEGTTINIIDFHKVFVRYAEKSVHGKIHLNTHISKIDRTGIYPTIFYHDKAHVGAYASSQKCSAVIMAFPPILSALKAANIDLLEEERAVFSQVGTNAFWSGAVRMKTPQGITFSVASSSQELPPDAAGEPVVFTHFHNNSDVVTTSSWGQYRGNTTTNEVYSLLKSTLSKVNKDPRNNDTTPVPITDSDILAIQQNDYFPHFDAAQLAAGYYVKFNDLQGRNGTFWASGLNMFELVEYALRAGKDVVDSYF